MDYTKKEVLQFVMENDVKFVRLAFTDIFGTLKNISILSSELPRAFDQGISFDASSVDGFMNVEESDLYLHPDPATLAVLPWRPQTGRVVRFYCDITYPDGSPFAGGSRAQLKAAVKDAADMGFTVKIGTECEFYLFEMNELGRPTKIPQDFAGYMDVAPIDKGENVRREICLTLEEMGLFPETSHHETGPGQNEIDFHYSDALTAADNLQTFKFAVRSIAARNGLFASFLPKPLPNESGSGLHINLSLAKNGLNIFKNTPEEHSADSESFIAGILDRAGDMTAFLNPLTNSYARFGSFEAPAYVTWSHQNRSQLIRIPAAQGEYARMELRSPDPSCNPYTAFTLLIRAGLEGIKKEKKLCPPSNFNAYTATISQLEAIKKLPETLNEALIAAGSSEFIKENLPERTLNTFLAVKQREWEGYQKATDKERFERETYFYQI